MCGKVRRLGQISRSEEYGERRILRIALSRGMILDVRGYLLLSSTSLSDEVLVPLSNPSSIELSPELEFLSTTSASGVDSTREVKSRLFL